MKKGVNKIENWYKMLQNGQVTDFSETLDQLQIISGAKCNRDKPIFSTESGSQYDVVGHKRTQHDWKMAKKG